MCRRVPYLGRSTSPALVEMEESVPANLDWLVPRPDQSISFDVVGTIRCPFPGSLGLLRAAHEAKYLRGEVGDPWAIGRYVEYGRPMTPALDDVANGPYREMVILRLEGSTLDGRHAARLTSALRQALLSLAREPVPALHGHHPGDILQCAYLALPFVGHEHADGHLLGLAVAIPDLPADQLAVVNDALTRLTHVTAGPLGVVRVTRLSPLDSTREPWGLRPQRWLGPSRDWVTALPIVFDRYLRRTDSVEEAARMAAVNSRLPQPGLAIVSRQPLLRGAPDLAPEDTVRHKNERGFKPYRHAVIRFPKPVRGPVVIGSMRHYGLGLCVPVEG
jgi:CRISPR-associated protein Csb2